MLSELNHTLALAAKPIYMPVGQHVCVSTSLALVKPGQDGLKDVMPLTNSPGAYQITVTITNECHYFVST